VAYVLAVFSAEQLALPISKRVSKGATMYLSTEEPWDTMKAQILVKISQLLDPKILDFDNYKVTATIPRIIAKPGIPLASDSDYMLLTQRLLGTHNTVEPLANIKVEELNTSSVNLEDKENDVLVLERKSKKAKKDPAQLPRNVAKSTRIIALHDKWKCPKKTAQCIGEICYIGPEFEGHFPMGHEHIDCWASYSLKADPNGLLTMPPNHHLFPRTGISSSSPVLQRRLEAQNHVQTPATPSPQAPMFNFQIRNDFLSLLHGSSNLPPSSAPITTNPTTPNTSTPVILPDDTLDNKLARIFPATRTLGVNMSIKDFCSIYGLDDAIQKKLEQHGFREAKHLQYLTQGNLIDIDFLLGEIAVLQDA
ncbi:hypothetical protein BDQ17DRAFT_1213759, partial [Cyathus striatus]